MENTSQHDEGLIQSHIAKIREIAIQLEANQKPTITPQQVIEYAVRSFAAAKTSPEADNIEAMIERLTVMKDATSSRREKRIALIKKAVDQLKSALGKSKL